MIAKFTVMVGGVYYSNAILSRDVTIPAEVVLGKH